jgi:dihydroorotase
MTSTLIVNARLVNEGREFDGDLRFADGRIEQIGNGLAARAGETVIDAAGRRLLPGMIDDQVHFREPGMEYKADMAIESAAAVAGGLTSFMDMPNTVPPTLDAAALEDKYRRAAGRCHANYGFYMGASNDNLEAVRAIDPRATPGLKVFMGASTGNMLVDNPEVLDAIFRDAPCRSSPTARTRRRSTPPSRVQGAVRRRHPGGMPPADPLARGLHQVHAPGDGAGAQARRAPACAAHQHRRRTGAVRAGLIRADGRQADHRRDLRALPALRPRATTRGKGNLIKCNPAIKDEARPRGDHRRTGRRHPRRAGHRPCSAHAGGKGPAVRQRAQRPAAGAVRSERRPGTASTRAA